MKWIKRNAAAKADCYIYLPFVIYMNTKHHKVDITMRSTKQRNGWSTENDKNNQTKWIIENRRCRWCKNSDTKQFKYQIKTKQRMNNKARMSSVSNNSTETTTKKQTYHLFSLHIVCAFSTTHIHYIHM